VIEAVGKVGEAQGRRSVVDREGPTREGLGGSGGERETARERERKRDV
jgi:hypothetical protein